MNQQEAGRTVKEIMSYGDFRKKTVYDEKYWSSTNVLLLEDLLIHLWEQDKWLWGNSPGRHPVRALHQGHQQVDEVPVAGDKHLQNNCGKDGVEDRPDIWKSPLHLPAWTVTLPTTTRGSRIGSRRASREVRKKEIWPSSSPQCNPFDYFAGGISEFRVRANLPTKPEAWGCMHRRVYIKKTWLSAFSYAQSCISLVFCRSLGFLVPWSSSLTAVSDLADFLWRMWVDFFVWLQKLYLTDMFEWLLSYIQLW
jgi:hypothetical protein